TWTVTHDGQPFTPGSPTDVPTFHFTPDGNGIWIVNLKVTDQDGGVGQSSTAVQVTGGVLTASISDAPTANVLEGTPLTLVAELADLISPTLLHYEWSVTKLGAHGGLAVPFASGTAATFTFTPDDDGTYTVNLTVIDTQGAAGTAAPVTIVVSNVP